MALIKSLLSWGIPSEGIDCKLAEKGLGRVAGILLLGVFAINTYLGVFDSNLKGQLTSSTNGIPLHWYINWVIAAITLVAAVTLISSPLSALWVTLSGIVWPIVYVGGLGFDVYTRLCAGGGYCWPSKTAAFQYLILNNPNAPGGGWNLFPFTIPTAIGLLFIAWVLSAWALYSIRKGRTVIQKTATAPAAPSGESPVPNPSTPTRYTNSRSLPAFTDLSTT